MTELIVAVWLAFATAHQAPAGPGPLAKSLEGTWAIDNAHGVEADIVVTISHDANGVLLVKAAFGGSETVTRYDPTGKDTTNVAPGQKTPATFRSRIINQRLVTEIWDGPPQGPPHRIETRWMESADVMMTELSKTAGGPMFSRVALRRRARLPPAPVATSARLADLTTLATSQ